MQRHHLLLEKEILACLCDEKLKCIVVDQYPQKPFRGSIYKLSEKQGSDGALLLLFVCLFVWRLNGF